MFVRSHGYFAVHHVLLGVGINTIVSLLKSQRVMNQQRLTRSDLGVLAMFYFFMALNYYLVLAIDSGIVTHYFGVSINHILKGIISIPYFWLLFKLDLEKEWRKLLLIHSIGVVIYVFIWVSAYYAVCDALGVFRFTNTRMVWDYYFAAIFYVLQFGMFHLYQYYRKVKRQELLVLQLSELKLESELSALKAQLNPHFLYNVFNTINAAIPKSAKAAREMVTKLADLFRYQLASSKQNHVPLGDELNFVAKYLDLEKERFGSRLTYTIDVPQELFACQVLPMLIQPLVENSIKHGISPLVTGGEIIVKIRRNVDQLAVSITDTGMGMEDLSRSTDHGTGLKNTRTRLEKKYGTSLRLAHHPPSGLAVNFNLPLNLEP